MMELQAVPTPVALVLGAYAGLVAQGAARGVVRLSSPRALLLDLVRLALLAAATALLCWPPLAAALLALAAFCLYSALPSPLLPAPGRAVFVTGQGHGQGPSPLLSPPGQGRLRHRSGSGSRSLPPPPRAGPSSSQVRVTGHGHSPSPLPPHLPTGALI